MSLFKSIHGLFQRPLPISLSCRELSGKKHPEVKLLGHVPFRNKTDSTLTMILK